MIYTHEQSMNKLYFLVNWKNNKRTRWSGTCWGLYTALKRYFDVIDIPLKEHTPSILIRIMRKFHILSDDMDIRTHCLQRSDVCRVIREQQVVPIFQFAEVYDSDLHPTYIYQDLNVSYLLDLAERDPERFQFSSFAHYSIKAIQRRKKNQNDYYQNAKGIFVMARWLKEYMIDKCCIPASKVHHVGGAINVDPQKIDYSRKTKNKILFVGHDYERKGGPLVLKAFCELLKRMPSAELYIIGPPTNPNIHNFPNIYYIHSVTYDQLVDYYNKCDILCQPSYFEAYGFSFIEALTFGLPCIGRNCYEMPYHIQEGQTGFLIDNDDICVLANKMYSLLHADHIHACVQANREYYIKQYAWEAVAKRIATVIDTDTSNIKNNQ